MAEFTPGPWRLGDGTDEEEAEILGFARKRTGYYPRGWGEVTAQSGSPIVEYGTYCDGDLGGIQNIDDALLIAAAPDLYEALAHIVTQGPDAAVGHAHIEVAIAALAKAKGEST